MTDERYHGRSRSFGAAAALYERARPSYPVEAARWMLGEQAVRVVDLGAGTGKFSRLLASLGHEVVPVEPDAAMLEVLEASSPGLDGLAGSAAAIPLPDGSVDAVVAAQSYHWFDTDEARAEIARVLRPGGVFGPIWNIRDGSVPWVAELSRRVLHEDVSSTARTRLESFGPRFDAAERAEFRHSTQHDRASLRDLVHSRSAYLVAEAAERAELDAAVEAIADGLPERFELPYVTIAYRVRRR